VLRTYLYTAELITANPMPMVGRPKLAKTLPKALPTDAVAALLTALDADPQPRRRSDWVERDRALILTGLLAGLHADEMLRDVGDLRRNRRRGRHTRSRQGQQGPPDPDRIGIGRGPRALPRQPGSCNSPPRPSSAPPAGIGRLAGGRAAVVGADGDRITRGTLQYRVLRAFCRAGAAQNKLYRLLNEAADIE
jgi:integrase/recombinase XerC